MKFLRITALASFVVAAVAVGAGTSYAQPAPPSPIGYEVNLVDKTIVTTLDNGRFDVAADQRSVDIADAAGNSVLTLPLSFAVSGIEHPYATTISDDGRVLELTPDLDPAKASPSPLRPTASLLENQRAQEAFATQFGIATAIGSFTGLVIGAVAGAVIGCVLRAADPRRRLHPRCDRGSVDRRHHRDHSGRRARAGHRRHRPHPDPERPARNDQVELLIH